MTKTNEDLAALKNKKTQALRKYTRTVTVWVKSPIMTNMLKETQGEKVTDTWLLNVENAEKHLTSAYDALIESLEEYIEALESKEQTQEVAAEVEKADEKLASALVDQADHQKTLSTLTSHLKQLRLSYQTKIQKESGATGALGSTTGTSSSSKNIWDIKKDFRPQVLQADDTPAAMDLFLDRLQSYLPRAEIEKPEVNQKDIQQLVEMLMSDKLKSDIHFDRHKMLPLYPKEEGDDCLENRIKDHWRKQFPLATIRTTFYAAMRQPGEEFSTCMARIKDLFDRSEVHKMDPAEHLGFVSLKAQTGEEGKKIRDLVSEDPDVKDGRVEAKHVWKAYETIQRKAKNNEMCKGSEQVNRIQEANHSGQGGRKQRLDGTSLHPHLKALKSAGKCFNCAKTNCPKGTCIAKGKVCDHCKKPNHLIAACKNKYNEEHPRTPAGARPAPPAST